MITPRGNRGLKYYRPWNADTELRFWKYRHNPIAVLTGFKSAGMAQFEWMNATMNYMRVQLKILSYTTTNPKRTERKFYCRSCGRNFTRGSKTFPATKTGDKEEDYYKKRPGGSERGCEWWLGEIINKIEISNSKISLINCIGIPPNSPSNNMLSITDAGANIKLEKKATTKMPPVIISN